MGQRSRGLASLLSDVACFACCCVAAMLHQINLWGRTVGNLMYFGSCCEHVVPKHHDHADNAHGRGCSTYPLVASKVCRIQFWNKRFPICAGHVHIFHTYLQTSFTSLLVFSEQSTQRTRSESNRGSLSSYANTYLKLNYRGAPLPLQIPNLT